MKELTKKRLITFFISLTVIAISMFVECDVYFPDKIKIFQGEKLDIREGSPYSIDVAASGSWEANGEYNAEVKLFGVIPVKKVQVDVVPNSTIIPGGKTVGIKMFTRGLMCVGCEKIKGENGETLDAEDVLDLKNADMIMSVDGKSLHTIVQFAKIVSQSGGKELTLKISRNKREFEKKITPVKTKDGYKLGIWVRDSTAGIGTVTFVDEKSNIFGALGHPITDVDTGAIMPIEQGSVTETVITDVKQGQRGNPGELRGIFDQSGTDKGVLFKNTQRGIFGVLDENYRVNTFKEAVPMASKSQVKTGKAEIYANIEDDKIEKFEVEIVKVMKFAADDKNMVINITDKRLIEKTGGIVQGMSGSPIIQNGKLVGAVTHVFVNDPTRGYGIFIENMLFEAK